MAKTATKSEIIKSLVDKTGLSKKEVVSVMDALTDMINGQLGKKGPKIFTIPGLVKLRVLHKPATKARMGRNPFTGAEMMIKAKPARNVVKASPVKALKDAVM